MVTIDEKYDFWAVDESNDVVLFFETQTALEEWMLTGKRTWVATRAIVPEDLI